MPFWAICYCVVIVFSAFFAIYAFYKRGLYYIPGQLMSSLFSVMMFMYYYDVFFHKPDSVIVILFMFLYILYWECWENRNLFPLVENKKVDISKSTFDLTKRPVVSGNMFMAMVAVIIIISLPLIYTVIRLIISYY